ncbi:MAG: type II secretion system F family protein [Verrucomicrobia bacterium]|nr:type II secretion system F family protein [Verrucomicrobiota bacterium]
MSLFVTPGQFARRAELYLQLAQLTSAGIGIVRALEQVKRNPPARSFREPLQQMLNEIAKGRTFTQAAANTGDWLPEFDLALLRAGETTGRLDACFRDLADYYNERARLTKQMLGQLFYPVALIHFAAFVFLIILPFAASGMNCDAHLAWLFLRAALVLSPLYLGTVLLVYSLQSKHGEQWRATIEAILHPLPMLGTARHYLALARLATALEALLAAGVNIIEAWELAANASGSPALRKIVSAWKPPLAAGRTPAELLRDTARFPDMFSNLYTTGEVSGKLEESLGSLRRYYNEEGSRKLQTLASLMPKLVYLVVALVIAYNVINFYTGYFKQIDDASHF